jgi:hypothetical protein
MTGMNARQMQCACPGARWEGRVLSGTNGVGHAGLTTGTCTSDHRVLANVQGRFCCSCWPGSLNGGGVSPLMVLGPWQLQCGAVQPALAR